MRAAAFADPVRFNRNVLGSAPILAAGALALAGLAHPAMAADQHASAGTAGVFTGGAVRRPGPPPDTWTVTAPPRVTTLLIGRIQYDPSTCTSVDMGAWTVNKQPKYGTPSFGTVSSTLGNGDCPGILFDFAGIYYTWPGGANAGKTDQFTATWKSTGFTYHDDFNVTLAVSNPVNFHQVGDGVAKPGGVLHFNYAWDSSSGELSDLTNCAMGENVVYPSSKNPFKWPSPPYNGSTPNPTILWVDASDGAAQDNHSPTGFIEPYEAKRFKAQQTYRYRCPVLGIVNFDGFVDIPIVRNVSDSTGRGCWGYQITKSGASASIPRLPHVKGQDCTASATHGDRTAGPANSAADVELSLAASPRPTALGAPLYAELAIHNRQARPIDVDLGLNRNANLVLTIRLPGGGIETRELSGAGFGRSGRLSLAANQTALEQLLLNDWYDFPRAGTYQVRVTLKGDAAAKGGQPSTDFAVQVLPRDGAALKGLAEKLAGEAISGPTFAARAAAADALSHIVDPVAVDSLRRVLDQGLMVESYAIAGLTRIGSPEAVAALMATAQHHPDRDVRAAAQSALSVMDGSQHSAPEPRD